MREMTCEEMKFCQFEILKYVDWFCCKNGIRYFLGYGTLLGAVRHKGYIPWDDDIDIIMPRPDYEKFNELFGHSCDRYRAVPVSASSVVYSFTKIEDCDTLLEESEVDHAQIGVNIDLFPIDGVSNNKIAACFHFWFCLFLDKLRVVKVLNSSFVVDSSLKKWVLCFFKMFLLPIKVNKIINWINQSAKKNDYITSKYVANLVVTEGKFEKMPRDIFERAKYLVFERKDFPVPFEYEQYLKIIYGDYMTLPPVDKQVSHHAFKAFTYSDSKCLID